MKDLRKANKLWFAEGNRRFFGDLKYDVIYKEGKPYFLQITKKWSDMFGSENIKIYHIIKEISDYNEIGDVVVEFESLSELNSWINE